MQTTFPRASRGCRGTTLIETTAALFVLAVGVATAASMIVSGMRLDRANRENEAVLAAARAQLETVRSQTFSQIVALYDTNTGNDPGGAGTAPGRYFTQPALQTIAKSSSVTAQVLLPLDVNGLVREDLDMPELGLPRDLNGDGVVDSVDHAADAIVLPVGVQIKWTGPSGPQTYTLATMVHP